MNRLTEHRNSTRLLKLMADGKERSVTQIADELRLTILQVEGCMFSMRRQGMMESLPPPPATYKITAAGIDRLLQPSAAERAAIQREKARVRTAEWREKERAARLAMPPVADEDEPLHPDLDTRAMVAKTVRTVANSVFSMAAM